MFFLCCCLFLLTIACSKQSTEVKKIPALTEYPIAKEKEQLHPTITFAAVGDLLIHDRVYNKAKTDTGYDFMPMMQSVQPFIEKATVAFANQETMIGGEEIGLSSYPSFNSPQEVGDAVKMLGFDIVSIANNHTLDRGEEAILRSIDYWNSLDIPYVGAYESEADAKRVRVIETEEGISLAFIAYTYGTNGIPVPDGKDYLVNFIDREKIAMDIAEARELADVVVASLHFGEEYEMMPNQIQTDLVQFVADEGVDIVVGHHPHVLQPIDWVEGKNGNQTFVVYSLGNFFSGQRDFEKQTGGMVEIQLTKDKDTGEIELHSPAFLLTYVTAEDWILYPFYALTKDELPNHEQLYEEMKEHMSQWVSDLHFIEDR